MRATEILCQCCSDVAITFEEGASIEDGLTCACNSCGVLGHVDIDCDEDGSYVRFWPLTESEAMRLENTTLLEAYLKNQEIIDRLMEGIGNLAIQNKRLKTAYQEMVDATCSERELIVEKLGIQVH